MATLSGTRLKDTYTGLLKTSDASNFTSSLKVIQDGSGNDSALSLSTSTVKAAALQVNTITGGSTSSKALVWNDSTKAIEHRPFPSNSTVSTTLGGSAAPTITIAAADATSTTITLAATDGLGYSRAGNTITIGRGNETINQLSVSTTLDAGNTGSTYYLNSVSGLVITLPAAAPGIVFKFIVIGVATGNIDINTASGDYVYGKAIVTSNSATGQSRVGTVASSAGNRNNIKLDPDSNSSGGRQGDVVDIVAVDSTNWLVTANLTTSSSTVGAVSVMPEP